MDDDGSAVAAANFGRWGRLRDGDDVFREASLLFVCGQLATTALGPPGSAPGLWSAWAATCHGRVHAKFFIYFLNHFAKLYNRLIFMQIWQPTAMRHGGWQGNRHGPRRQGVRQRSAVGSGPTTAYRRGPRR
jgi:hypothetical protein